MMSFSILAAGVDGATPTWVPLAYLVAGVFFILPCAVSVRPRPVAQATAMV